MEDEFCCLVLSKFCIDLLAVPHLLAAVEKVICAVNGVNEKKRNNLTPLRSRETYWQSSLYQEMAAANGYPKNNSTRCYK